MADKKLFTDRRWTDPPYVVSSVPSENPPTPEERAKAREFLNAKIAEDKEKRRLYEQNQGQHS